MINNVLNTNDALHSLCPGAQWQLVGSSIQWEEQLDNNNQPTGKIIPTNLKWFSPKIPIPTREQIDARLTSLQETEDSIKYQKLRQSEYPPLADFVDAMYWQTKGDNTKMTAYIAAVDAVKDKYPKE